MITDAKVVQDSGTALSHVNTLPEVSAPLAALDAAIAASRVPDQAETRQS